MNGGKLPRKKKEWFPPGRRRRRKNPKFMHAGSNNWNERRELTRNRSTDKKNKTIGIEICENINTLYINK
jgi:hypothetical protein